MRTAIVVGLLTSVSAAGVAAWWITRSGSSSPKVDAALHANPSREPERSAQRRRRVASAAGVVATDETLSTYQAQTVSASLEVLDRMEERARRAADPVLLGRVSRQRERLIAAARALPRDGQLQSDSER